MRTLGDSGVWFRSTCNLPCAGSIYGTNVYARCALYLLLVLPCGSLGLEASQVPCPFFLILMFDASPTAGLSARADRGIFIPSLRGLTFRTLTLFLIQDEQKRPRYAVTTETGIVTQDFKIDAASAGAGVTICAARCSLLYTCSHLIRRAISDTLDHIRHQTRDLDAGE